MVVMFSGFFERRKGEDVGPPSDTSHRRKYLTLYYALYKRTRCIFIPPLCNANYAQSVAYAQQAFNNLLQLKSVDFNTLQRYYPFPLIFITPRKKAVALYSLYSCAYAEILRKQPPATYKDLATYLRVNWKDLKMYVKYRLMLYKSITPFRIILGYPVARKGGGRLIQNQKIVFGDAEEIFSKFLTPSMLMMEIYNVGKRAGIAAAVQFTYSVLHASDRIAKILKTSKDVNVLNLIATNLRKRYETILSALPHRPPSPLTTAPPIPREVPRIGPKPISSAQQSTSKFVINFCPNCGTKVPPGANFCPNCGRRLRF